MRENDPTIDDNIGHWAGRAEDFYALRDVQRQPTESEEHNDNEYVYGDFDFSPRRDMNASLTLRVFVEAAVSLLVEFFMFQLGEFEIGLCLSLVVLVTNLMQDDSVNHCVNRENDASWNDDDEDKPKHLIAFGDDVVVEAPGDRQILMPHERKESDDRAEHPAQENLQRDVLSFLRISEWENN